MRIITGKTMGINFLLIKLAINPEARARQKTATPRNLQGNWVNRNMGITSQIKADLTCVIKREITKIAKIKK